MHRFRSWTLDPPEWRTQRNRLLPAEGGDGSTLSLDFTSGVLDPRLTFTRSTNATFINSQGLVEFAAANILRNSVMAGGSTSGLSAPTSWSAGVSGESYRTQIVIDGCEQWKQVASSTRPYIVIAIPNTELAVGVEYVASVYLDSFTTGLNFTTISDLLSYNTPTGTTVSSSTWVAPDGSTGGGTQPLAVGRIQFRFVLSAIGGSGFQLRIGIGVQNTATGTVEFSRPQCERGTVAKPFLANTSTIAANYNTPRFDYDPSTRQTRGLLIEGTANNLLCLSESFATSGGTTNWAYNGNSGAVTSEVNPAGVESSFQFRETATGGGLLHQPVTPALPAGGQTYTFSIWMRGSVYSSVTTTQAQIGIQVGGTFQTVTPRIVGGYAASISGTTICTVSGLSTTQWARVEIATTASIAASTTVNVFVWPNTTSYENNASVLLWGAQFESGSGASSYIPTGASTGNRAFDSCVIEDITSLQYSTKAGTMFYAGRFTQMNASSFPNRVGFTRETGDFRTFAALSTTPSLLPCFANSGTTVLTTQNITLNSELKLAFSFDANLSTAAVKSSLNGGAIVQSGASALTESSVPTYFMLGQRGYGAFFPHGTVRSVKYWPSALPTAQLQAISTL